MTQNIFLLLDAARVGDHFKQCREIAPEGKSLYVGNGQRHLDCVAPYLFDLDESPVLKKLFFEHGWTNAWGTMVATETGLADCVHHFRKFLFVNTEEGRRLYFRFYDPRVLKMFLPTCDKNQLIEFFGPIQYFIVEGATREEAIRFWHSNGDLRQQKYKTSEYEAGIDPKLIRDGKM